MILSMKEETKKILVQKFSREDLVAVLYNTLNQAKIGIESDSK